MAGYSLGQMISCWLFGWWSQVTASTRYPAIFGLLLAAGGNVLYGLLPALPYNRKWYMLVARLFTGWGAGESFLLDLPLACCLFLCYANITFVATYNTKWNKSILKRIFYRNP